MLETVGAVPDDALIDAWKQRVVHVRALLGWPEGPIVARLHASGASLAFSAPVDQLFCATEVNEWAWLASLGERRMRETVDDLPGSDGGDQVALLHAPGHPAAWDEDSALRTLHAFARAERNPRLAELVAAAQARRLTVLVDDDAFSIGCGGGAEAWPLVKLPAPESIDWSALHDIPIALVTGSNGKTTSVRLLAAIARAHGLHAAYSCTDGLFIDDRALEAGDYSGPAGARALLRHAAAEIAILETARGGILRRGIAPPRADVAIVTNISDDHFGEYGIHTLDDLAAVKLTVARVVAPDGVLVLNADDRVLAATAAAPAGSLAWFALDDAHPRLAAHREHGGATCGVREGRLVLAVDGSVHDLGEVAKMPLTLDARATYNIANIAAAALAASALGIAPATIADVVAHFGRSHEDNPGRLQRWTRGKTTVFLDYAHNPDGLRGLLEVATTPRGNRRLILVLGQAGNRGDAEIRELAATAAGYAPDLVVLKDMHAMLRGRAVAEVPAILRAGLADAGVPASAVIETDDEVSAARTALDAAREGDIVVLPIHGPKARVGIVAMLDAWAAAL